MIGHEYMYVSIDTVAQQIDSSTPTIYRWIDNGTFISPIQFPGRTVRFDSNELDTYFEGLKEGRDVTELVRGIISARSSSTADKG